MAHERAVFKAAAVVSETKRVLKNLDAFGLAELRALQKPDNEIEDLLATIIIIGNSINSIISLSSVSLSTFYMANLNGSPILTLTWSFSYSVKISKVFVHFDEFRGLSFLRLGLTLLGAFS